MGSYLPSIKKNGEIRKPPKANDNPIYSPVDNLVGYLPAIEPEQIPDPRHTKYADICVNSAKQAADDANLVKTINDEFNRKADDVLGKLTSVDEQVELATTAANTATSYASVATNKATEAMTKALMAEGYSVGEQNGEPVEEGSPYYQNNAKYYAEQAIARTITVTPITTSGTHIADITVDGITKELYAPDDGTVDYEDLDNKPQINGVELTGNKTLSTLGIASESALNALATIVGSVNAELEEV